MRYLAGMIRRGPIADPLRRLRLLPLILWAGALAFLSLSPGVKAPAGLFGWDKFNHFVAYAVLALLLIRALHHRFELSSRLLIVSWLLCFVYGLLFEGLQWVMGIGRQWEWGDLLANGLGAMTACVIFRHIGNRYWRRTDDR